VGGRQEKERILRGEQEGSMLPNTERGEKRVRGMRI
jgi:hypothetical protein